MSSYWDEIFADNYEKLQKTLCLVWFVSVPGRILLWLFSSYEIAFANNQVLILISLTFMMFVHVKCSKSHNFIKKTLMILHMQFALLTLRYLALKSENRTEIIYCILSTVIMKVHETSIYASNYWVSFVLIKHILVWFFVESTDYTFILQMSGKTASIYVTTVLTILLSIYFDSTKNKIFLTNYKVKHKCKAARDQFLEILKLFPDGLIVIDSNFQIKFENNLIQNLLGQDPISKLFLIPSIYNDTDVPNLIQNFIKNEEMPEKSLGVISIDSKQFEVRVHRLKWLDEVCFMITIKDVSNILGAERISAENNTKNLIIRSISHELRTPINCINLILDELNKKLPKDLQEKVYSIKTCTRLLTYQINDILDYSDLTAGKFITYKSDMNLREELRSCLETIKFQASYKRVRINFKFDHLLPDRVVTDSYRIQKVVVNLLTNALKYTSHGKIKLYGRHEGSQVVIGVKDTGVGIPEERKKQIEKTLNDSSSTGINCLSLHVCQKILENFNSNLNFTSTPSHGSDFYFKIDLPTTRHRKTNSRSLKSLNNPSLSDDDLEIPCESVSCCDLRQLSFRSFEREISKIMIVDDNEFNRMCLANLLRSEGIDFIEALNGQMAVEKTLGCDKMKAPLRCIIMDLNMPIMDGWNASRLISQLYAQGKLSKFPAIIAHTAYSSQEDIKKCYESGMVTYISKPSTHEAILTIIKKYIS